MPEMFVMPFRPAFDGNTRTIPGAQAWFTLHGTNTPSPVYTLSGLTIPHPNPLVANGVGRFPTAYLDPAITAGSGYRVRIYDDDAEVGVDTPIEEYDPYTGAEQGMTGPIGPIGSISISGIQWVTPQQFQVSSGLPLALGGGAQNDSAAFVAAIAYLGTQGLSGFGYGQGTPKLFIPHGHYYLGTTTLDITYSMIIEGEQGADAGGGSTVLRWAAGATGIRVQAANTTGASGTQAAATHRGDGSIIRNLMLVGGYTAGDAEYHGIHLRAKSTIRDCYIANFQGDGIYANATAGSGGASEGNVNCFEFTRLIITGCRSGVYLNGADVNAGSGNYLDLMNNRVWGIRDQSFLGNTWTACHTSGNVSGPYFTSNANSCSVFVGCYSESDQPASSFSARTLVLGGLHAAGVGTAAWLRGDDGAVDVPQALNVTGVVTGAGGVVSGNGVSTVNGKSLISYAGSGFTGDTIESGSNVNFGAVTGIGVMASNTGGGTRTLYLSGNAEHWVDSTDGAVRTALDITGLNITGAYKILGTQVVGARGAAVADATDAASAITQLNALLARCRAHGLIA